MTAALLAVLLAAAHAADRPPALPEPAGGAFSAADAELDGLQERMQARRREAEPPLDALAKLKGRYEDPAALDAAGREREALRASLGEALAALRADAARFDGLRESTELQKVALGMQVLMNKGEVPKAAGTEFVRSNLRLEFSLEVRRLLESAAALLAADDEAFRAAEVRAERERAKRLQMWGLAGAGALLLAVTALLVMNSQLRRAARPLPPPQTPKRLPPA